MDRCRRTRRSPQPTRPDASRGCSRKCRSVRYTYSSLSSFVVARRVAAGPIKAVPRRRRDTRKYRSYLENNARRACPSGSLSATPRARVRHSRHGSHRAIHHILRQGHRQRPGDLHRCARRTRPRASPSFPASQISPHLGRTFELPRELTLPPLPAHSAQVPSSPCGCSRRPSGSGSRIRATRYASDTSRYIPRDATSRALVRSDAQNHSPAERIFPTPNSSNRCLRS